MNRSWTIINNSCINHQKVMSKLLTSHEQFIHKSILQKQRKSESKIQSKKAGKREAKGRGKKEGKSEDKTKAKAKTTVCNPGYSLTKNKTNWKKQNPRRGREAGQNDLPA